MLTSESNVMEFKRFFKQNEIELSRRLDNVINKKYRRTFLQILKRGGKLPSVSTTLKIGDVTLVACALNYQNLGNVFDFKFLIFLVMKDLRKQSKIMVLRHDDADCPIDIYSSHAVRRYKERIGLDPDTDFLEVCKHMVTVGRCGNQVSQFFYDQIYGTNIDRRLMSMTCLNGVFLGYRSIESKIRYAQTFLTSEELRADQKDMDPNYKFNRLWTQVLKLHDEGVITPTELNALRAPLLISNNFSFKDLTATTYEENDPSSLKVQESFKKQIKANRSKAYNRIMRKGYK